MHEQAKLDEAAYFFGKMKAEVREPKGFKHCLSAFLSSARSVLQYALKEARAKPAGQAWHDASVTGKTVVKFFKDKRDVNIHVQPVTTSTQVNVKVEESISSALISESVSIHIVDDQGNWTKTGEGRADRPPPTPELKPEKVSVEYRYLFADWLGAEDVITLCSLYLDELGAIVKDGRSKGFLTL